MGVVQSYDVYVEENNRIRGQVECDGQDCRTAYEAATAEEQQLRADNAACATTRDQCATELIGRTTCDTYLVEKDPVTGSCSSQVRAPLDACFANYNRKRNCNPQYETFNSSRDRCELLPALQAQLNTVNSCLQGQQAVQSTINFYQTQLVAIAAAFEECKLNLQRVQACDPANEVLDPLTLSCKAIATAAGLSSCQASVATAQNCPAGSTLRFGVCHPDVLPEEYVGCLVKTQRAVAGGSLDLSLETVVNNKPTDPATIGARVPCPYGAWLMFVVPQNVAGVPFGNVIGSMLQVKMSHQGPPDAMYSVTLYTVSGSNIADPLGTLQFLGSVNFYPNGSGDHYENIGLGLAAGETGLISGRRYIVRFDPMPRTTIVVGTTNASASTTRFFNPMSPLTQLTNFPASTETAMFALTGVSSLVPAQTSACNTQLSSCIQQNANLLPSLSVCQTNAVTRRSQCASWTASFTAPVIKLSTDASTSIINSNKGFQFLTALSTVYANIPEGQVRIDGIMPFITGPSTSTLYRTVATTGVGVSSPTDGTTGALTFSIQQEGVEVGTFSVVFVANVAGTTGEQTVFLVDSAGPRATTVTTVTNQLFTFVVYYQFEATQLVYFVQNLNQTGSPTSVGVAAFTNQSQPYPSTRFDIVLTAKMNIYQAQEAIARL